MSDTRYQHMGPGAAPTSKHLHCIVRDLLRSCGNEQAKWRLCAALFNVGCRRRSFDVFSCTPSDDKLTVGGLILAFALRRPRGTPPPFTQSSYAYAYMYRVWTETNLTSYEIIPAPTVWYLLYLCAATHNKGRPLIACEPRPVDGRSALVASLHIYSSDH